MESGVLWSQEGGGYVLQEGHQEELLRVTMTFDIFENQSASKIHKVSLTIKKVDTKDIYELK